MQIDTNPPKNVLNYSSFLKVKLIDFLNKSKLLAFFLKLIYYLFMQKNYYLTLI